MRHSNRGGTKSQLWSHTPTKLRWLGLSDGWGGRQVVAGSLSFEMFVPVGQAIGREITCTGCTNGHVREVEFGSFLLAGNYRECLPSTRARLLNGTTQVLPVGITPIKFQTDFAQHNLN